MKKGILIAVLVAGPAQALDIEIYTDRHHPAITGTGAAHAVTVHQVDALQVWAERAAAEVRAHDVRALRARFEALRRAGTEHLQVLARRSHEITLEVKAYRQSVPFVVISEGERRLCVVAGTADAGQALRQCRP